MINNNEKINLFDYLEYRQFLKDWYQFSKKHTRGFSFRAFSKKAGNPAPNFLQRVYEGKHNLTPPGIASMIKGLGLNRQEGQFFKTLVQFNQAKNHEEKNRYYQQLIQWSRFSRLLPLDKNQYLYFSTWYYPIVRELVISRKFNGSYEWLAKKIMPALTVDQAKKSVELLESMGFIKRNENGRYVQTEALVSTGHVALDLSIANYHLNVLSLVSKLFMEVDKDRRQSHTMTLGVAKEKIPVIRQKVQEFRNEIMALVADETDPEDVVLLSVHMLPVTREEE